MLAFRTLDLQAEKHVSDSSAPIATAVWAAAFSCVVLIQGGSAPAEKPGTNELARMSLARGGKSEIDRDRSEDRLKIGTGELADLFWIRIRRTDWT